MTSQSQNESVELTVVKDFHANIPGFGDAISWGHAYAKEDGARVASYVGDGTILWHNNQFLYLA